jgi:SAM-dependent methyltransferase
MDQQTYAFVSALPTETMDALEISGSAWGSRFRWHSYETIHYPAFDLCFDVVLNQGFDIIFLEQVLEHVRYPYRAVRNVYRMLRDGGWMVATTPFLIQIHFREMDYSRWTPKGLKYLLEECGFALENITTGAWGNRVCAIADFNACAEGRGWHTYDPSQHSLDNEPDYPIVVWAMARKGAGTRP